MYLASTPLVGLPSALGHSQVFTSADHHLVVVYALLGEQSHSFGDELNQALEATHFSSSIEVHTFFQEVLTAATEKGLAVEWALVYSNGTQVLFEVYQGLIILKRQGKVGVVIDTTAQLGIREGRAVAGDEIVLLTQSGRVFKQEIILKFEQGYDFETTLNSVVSGLHSSSQASFAAICFTSVSTSPSAEIENVETVGNAEENSIQSNKENVDAAENITHESHQQNEQLEVANSDVQSQEQSAQDTEKSVAQVQLQSASAATPTPILPFEPVTSKVSFRERLMPVVVKIWGAVKKTTQRIAVKIVKIVQASILLIRQVISQRDVYLGQAKKKERARILLIVLIVILLVGGVAGWWWWQRSQQRQAAEASLAPLNQQLLQAQQLATVDPVQARSSVELLLSQYMQLKAEYENQPVALSLTEEQLTQAQEILAAISGQTPISSLPVFLDLRSLEPGSIVTKAASIGNTAYFLDKDKKLVFRVELNTAQGSVIPLTEIEDLKDITTSESGTFVLGSQIWQIGADGTVQSRLDHEVVKTAKLISSFNTNLYLLVPDRRNVFRSVPNDANEYAAPTSWIRDFPDFEFTDSTSLMIDGQMWIGTRLGGLFVFESGNTTEFAISGLAEPFNSSIFMTTQPEFERVYVLEPAQERLVVLDKNGTFITQVKSNTLASAQSVVVNEDETKAFVVNGSLIYEIAL